VDEQSEASSSSSSSSSSSTSFFSLTSFQERLFKAVETENITALKDLLANNDLSRDDLLARRIKLDEQAINSPRIPGDRVINIILKKKNPYILSLLYNGIKTHFISAARTDLYYEVYDDYAFTLLHWATLLNQPKEISALLKKGADIDAFCGGSKYSRKPNFFIGTTYAMAVIFENKEAQEVIATYKKERHLSFDIDEESIKRLRFYDRIPDQTSSRHVRGCEVM
jgi:hypothetical protein